jgi:hypothetical protein
VTSGGLYVLGGQQRGARPMSGGLDWYEYERGLILEVDPETGSVEQRLSYQSPPGTRVEEEPVVLFKSATLVDDILYACTQTEVMSYRVPGFEPCSYLSLPRFNDVHHVRPTAEGGLLVAISGLDQVVELGPDGSLRREWSAIEGERPWDRFDPAIDYRLVRTTKPHHAHPNHVFQIDDEVWATRFEQRDAISLTRPGRRIPIDLERPHDGLVHDGRVWFTTVNGKIVVADTASLAVVEVIDLTELQASAEPLGWARGIHLDAAGGLWVGFSRIRPTKFRENVAWVARGFKNVRPTRIDRYDLASRRLTHSIDLEPAGLSAVFSIHGVPTTTAG